MKHKLVEVIPPANGWEPQTWYLVDVSYRSGNPIHRSLFYSGFLSHKEKTPAGYNGFVPLNGPDFEELPKEINQVRFVRVIKKLFSEAEGLSAKREIELTT